MNPQDRFMAALTIWREGRSLGLPGMTAIMWVILNRLATRRWGLTVTDVVTAPSQFDALVILGDPETVVWPSSRLAEADLEAWEIAKNCVAITMNKAAKDDPTKGATAYFADTIAPPYWAAKMTKTLTVGNTSFYR